MEKRTANERIIGWTALLTANAREWTQIKREPHGAGCIERARKSAALPKGTRSFLFASIRGKDPRLERSLASCLVFEGGLTPRAIKKR